MPVGLIFLLLSLLSIKERVSLNLLRTKHVWYFALWILWPLAFFAVFIDKAGYLLVALAPIHIITAKAILGVTSKLRSSRLRASTTFSVVIANTVLCILWFVFPAQANGMPTKIERPTSLRRPPMSDYNWDISYRAILVEDSQMDIITEVLDLHSLDGYGAEETALIYTDGRPRWRKLMYYFPQYCTYWLVDVSNSGIPEFGTEVYVAYQHKEDSYSGLAFWLLGDRTNKQTVLYLPSKIQRVLWFISEDSDFFRELSSEELISGYWEVGYPEWTIPYTDLDLMGSLNIGSFTFLRNEHTTDSRCL
jgi:hypothetical protein